MSASEGPLLRSANRTDASGVSLVELLVAATIIAILAALLLPALPRSREKSRKAGCEQILRQVYLLTRIYADDHEGEMPLRSALFPKDRFPHCPSSPPELKGGGYSWIPYYYHREPGEKLKINPQWILVGDFNPWHDPNRTWEPPPIQMWTGRHNLLYGDGRIAWEKLSSP